MTPRRYLLVIDSLQCGGAERHVVDLAGALTARGHDVTIACSVAGHFASQAEESGVRVVALCDELVKRRFSVPFARQVRRMVATERFDVVHGHLYAGGLSAAYATAGTGIPLVLTEQTEGPWRTARQRLASRVAYARARRVIGVSNAIVADLERRYRVSPGKLRYVPNGVAVKGGRAREAGAQGPVVGLVARLREEKDVPTFLRAGAHLAERFPEATFRIAGEGPLRGSLEALVRELGLSSRVQFLGVVDDIEQFLEGIDVLACSSVAEGTPLAIAEAMAAGVPVVATATGGIPDQIRDGREGLLVPARDPRALADRVAVLLEEPATARRIAEAAERRALAEFSVAAMASKTAAVYEEMLESTGPVPGFRGAPMETASYGERA